MEPDESSWLLIREAAADHRDALVAMLLEDGWSPAQVDEWATTGVVLELYDPAFLVQRGAAIVRSAGPATYELLAWSTGLDVDSVAERLVRAIGDILRRNGCERVRVPVVGVDAARLTPLLTVGFRPIARDGCPANTDGGGDGPLPHGLEWLAQEL